ncbi:hypothetical protein BBD42_24895 [Paenibacillus sp. BIHB 4019]|uniref:Beta-ketoacyl-[acyl-carrier-protein] synthase III C-terminal domain-containing protein n=1 Tax=Paenibacillus sp. BIHB 4019 TaxID=1870819 RepID=A0A1B2DNS6_9BACL|nr:hypothetical protein [Paenibacillus sp. BIHB 4019]ANY69358.1 hypothetical protein BBD42_24895 [Paenibacillus sp. BIHB 4019]
MTVEEAVGQGLEAGVDFAGTAQQYASKGFQYVPVEKKLGFEEMARRVIEPAVRQAADRSLTISAVLLASVTNEASVHRQAVQRIVREMGLIRTMVVQLGEYGCSTVHLALHLAERFYASFVREGEAILFVTADKAGKPSERVNRYMVFGDGACSALYTPEPSLGGHATYGVEIRADGFVFDDSSQPSQQSRQYFSTSYLGVRHVVRTLLRRFSLDLGQICAVYCTNLGMEQWTGIAMAIGCTPDKIYRGTLPEFGHMHNVDVLHSVACSVQDGLLQPGDYYLTVSIGFGGYYGCALHQYVPLESGEAR